MRTKIAAFASCAALIGVTAITAYAAAQTAPPLRVVPYGTTEKPTTSKAPAKKAPAKTTSTNKAAPAKAATKTATSTKAAAPKTTASKAPVTKTAAKAPATKTLAAAQAPTATKVPVAKAPAPKAAAPKAPATTNAPASVTAPPTKAVGPATSAPLAPSGPPLGSSGLSSSDWRPIDPENAIVYDTTKGRVIVELAPELAPGHVARIKDLVREGFYNGLAFHRVIENFMAQGGDPKGDGTGGSTKPNLRAEFNFRRGADFPFVRAVDRGGAAIGWVRAIPVTSQPDLLMERTADKRVSAWGNHCPGVASMARSEDDHSANSQFFLMRGPYPTLDRRYTIWGRAIIGLDVIRALKLGEPVTEPDRMVNVRVLADIPDADRPKVFVQRTDGPSFQNRLRTTMETRGAAFSNCDVMPEGRIVP